MTAAPPAWAVSLALETAALSPCRSKRGVVAYSPAGPALGGRITGHNGPPATLTCPGRERCAGNCGQGRERCAGNCGQRSVHAEVRALRAAQIARAAVATLGGLVRPLDLVHVELAADGGVVACAGPSCPSCAAQILDVGWIAGVWLYELCGEQQAAAWRSDHGVWHRYTAAEFYNVTLQHCGMVP